MAKKSSDKSLITFILYYHDCLCFIYSDICLLDSNKKYTNLVIVIFISIMKL